MNVKVVMSREESGAGTLRLAVDGVEWMVEGPTTEMAAVVAESE